NTPNWTHIHTADPENLLAPVGYNAIFATRPSLGTDEDGNLFVAWEQFDGENVEPGPPELCRADIFYSYSSDNGQSWAAAEKITTPSTVSHRFPAMMDHITDEVAVTYLIDQQAGFLIQGEGPMTNNPVVVQRWPNPIAGVKEKPATAPRALNASVGPNPFARNTRIRFVLPRAGEASLVVYDAAGRPVRGLAAGRMEPGRYSAAWDGRDDAGSRVAAGVYLYRLVLDGETVSGKLLLTN
ncbi:MAG TPA: T9SS type A sorting domain-containing protein, partial [candidate division WOR-3 bacterium]|nr:T9SS type A sorting domain-containing protein [candidate division WOR-3 bacterium]